MKMRYILLDFRDGINRHFGELEKYSRYDNIGFAGKIETGDLENILEVGPSLIDLSSSLERSVGEKDHMKINSFFTGLGVLTGVNS